MELTKKKRIVHGERLTKILMALGSVLLLAPSHSFGQRPVPTTRDIATPDGQPQISGLKIGTGAGAFFGEPSVLNFQIDGLSDRKVIKVESADSPTFSPRPGPIGFTPSVASSGAFYFVFGTFTANRSSCPQNRCSVKLRLTLQNPRNGNLQLFDVPAGVVAMSELQPQVITNTSELASILAFKPYSETHQTGVCKGTSSMPLQPSYPVGLSDHGVDDITFSIRSGPVGTECFWTSQWLALQQYWYIAKIEFEQVKTGNKCMVETGSTYMTLPHYNGLNLEGGAYAGNYDEVMFPENQRTALEPTGPDPVYLGPSNPTYISTMSTPRYVRPMLVRLACGLTLVNDNGVTLKLKAITLLGPPGADRRTALRSTFGIPPEVSR